MRDEARRGGGVGVGVGGGAWGEGEGGGGVIVEGAWREEEEGMRGG